MSTDAKSPNVFQRIVINRCYGGFRLSDAARKKLAEYGLTIRNWNSWAQDNRTHPILLRVVGELGDAASGSSAKLVIVEVPLGVEWTVEEYDGLEWVAERHRTWP